ncbi:MAG: TerB family tellurite resistance protein [Prevotella sp.]|nr:TerB family tellurite resistance protein [Prevotella sp.]
MTFTGIEMAAIAKLALAMANADGKVDKNELSYIALEMARFGVKDADPILKGGMEMDATIALSIVAKMNQEEKKYVTAYLGTLIAADGKIDDKEMALWKLTSSLCGLPIMNIAEAIEYVKKM